jgi:DsbC/DsbD-like thiol-disulfide interchange protein
MQNFFQRVDAASHRHFSFHFGCRGIAVVTLTAAHLLLVTQAGAQTLAGSWSPGPKSSVRLIAAVLGSPSPSWHGAVEIRLAPGALTYWRTPGGAGVAPVFSFDPSENIADVAVDFPAPTRIAEEGTEIYGYLDQASFPLRIVPREPDRPMRLAVTLSYAVCDRICLPAKANLSLDLPPGPSPAASDDALAVAIARAEAAIPRPMSDRERDTQVSIAPVAGAAPRSWRIVVDGAGTSDLFVEAAEGWYFESRKATEPGAFLVVEADRPRTAAGGPVPIIVTLTGQQGARTFGAVLDSGTAGR